MKHKIFKRITKNIGEKEITLASKVQQGYRTTPILLFLKQMEIAKRLKVQVSCVVMLSEKVIDS
jgi:hypothetical protein